MTVSARHENSVSRIRTLAPTIGAQVWINTQDGGKDGYKLPFMICDDDKPRSFIIDCLMRLKTGAMVAFEVEFQKEVSAVKKTMLGRIGIVTIAATPGSVDKWVEEPSLFEEEIAYWLERAGKVAKTNLLQR